MSSDVFLFASFQNEVDSNGDYVFSPFYDLAPAGETSIQSWSNTSTLLPAGGEWGGQKVWDLSLHWSDGIFHPSALGASLYEGRLFVLFEAGDFSLDPVFDVIRIQDSVNGDSNGSIAISCSAASDAMSIGVSWNAWSDGGNVVLPLPRGWVFPTGPVCIEMKWQVHAPTLNKRLGARVWERGQPVPAFTYDGVGTLGTVPAADVDRVVAADPNSQEADLQLGRLVISDNYDEDLSIYANFSTWREVQDYRSSQTAPAFIPEPRMFAPELLIPRRKPMGRVKIDPTHRYAPDLLCFVPSPWQMEELISGQLPTTVAGLMQFSPDGLLALDNANNDDTLIYEFPFDWRPFPLSIVTGFYSSGIADAFGTSVFFVRASGSALAGFYSNGGLSDWTLSHAGAVGVSGNTVSPNLWDGKLFNTVEAHFYDDGGGNYGIEGYVRGEEISVSGRLVADSSSGTSIGLLCDNTPGLHNSSPDDGKLPYFYAYKRLLSRQDMQHIRSDPYCFLLPEGG